MNGYERIKEEKKARIRHAAFQLFTENGYKKVKISDIAKAAEVSQVTIYNHFENKEALFRDCMLRFIDEQYQAYQAVFESERPFMEKIAYLFKEELEMAKRFHPETLQRLMVDDPVMSQYIQDFVTEKSVALIARLIEEGKKSGEVNPDYSTESIITYLNLLDRAIMQQPELFIGEDLYPLAKDLLHLVFYGLIGKPRRE